MRTFTDIPEPPLTRGVGGQYRPLRNGEVGREREGEHFPRKREERERGKERRGKDDITAEKARAGGQQVGSGGGKIDGKNGPGAAGSRGMFLIYHGVLGNVRLVRGKAYGCEHAGVPAMRPFSSGL
ncbi:hypothetical protein MTO96_025373 [Rhipicephalus appendiculatus]